MSTRQPLEAVENLARVLKRLKAREMRAFRDSLLGSERVFVTGLGRTGLMARGFAMRLMHVGMLVYHVGDVITPAIGKNDLLVICSRTGRSPVLLHYVGISRRAAAKVAVVTARPESDLARRADIVLSIDDRLPKRSPASPRLPLGSLFEQALLITLDQVILDLMDARGLSEEDMARIHTDLE